MRYSSTPGDKVRVIVEVSPMFDTSTDAFDSFESFLYQSTCCLCYNLFHREHLPSVENVWITNFTTKGASLSFYFFAAPPPRGRRPRLPAARGSLFLQELFYTNASLRGVKLTTKRGSLSSPWLFNIQTLCNRIANGRFGRSPFEIKAA